MIRGDRVMVIGHASGSVCSAIFPDEDEAVLFLPYSGDVLQSSAQAVEGLVDYFSCPSAERMVVPLSPDTESLLATLQQLGVDVDQSGHRLGFSIKMQPMLTCGLGSFSIEDIDAALLQDGVALGISGFRCLIRSDAGLLAKPLHLLYQDYPASLSPSGFFDLNVSFCRQRKGWRYSEVAFYWEDDCPFPALPIAQTHPLFEWGLNWGIATASGAHIVIHAAVVERHGAALVLPGQPGAGKSTLCADLVLSGWRLLSDELTIISRKTGLVQPLPRPISLKESSISLIRERYPDAVMSESVSETRKGEIAFLRPPAAAVSAWQEAIPVGHVIFPKYAAGEDLTVIDIPRSQALTGLLEHSFNVGLLGNAGFTALANVVAGVRAYEVTYGNATEIKEWIEAICR